VDRLRLQALLLRLTGSVELLVLGAVVMPRAWMEEAHRGLGLGDLPAGPVVDSLTRMTSFTYAVHGVALWFIAADVIRYRPLVLLTGAGYLVTAPVALLIELTAGMPMFWAVGEAGSCLLVGAAVLWAARPGAQAAAGPAADRPASSHSKAGPSSA
jgi:hypothetical protein